MELMTWEEIEKKQLEINAKFKEIENQLINADLEEEEFNTLSHQLELIQKTVLEFKQVKDEYLKDLM